jgi:hypothetical protein
MHDAGLRRAAVVRAAVEVAGRYGVGPRSPRVVEDTSSTIVWLAPHPIVAKVAVASIDRHPAKALLGELRIVQHLARSGAPVVAPSAEIPARVHLEDRYAMTFWQYQPQEPGRKSIDHRRAARSLGEVHAALASYAGSVESFTDQVDGAGEALADGRRLPTLPASDRLFLQAVHARLQERLADRMRERLGAPRPVEARLHGDPGPRKLLVNGEGCYLWIDFENACRGPVEWDLTALPGTGEGVFAGIDRGLLALLRDMRSVWVAVRSGLHPGGAADLDQAGRHHLALLRSRA